MIEPYFKTERGTLYHGDCLEVMAGLPDSSVDMVLTDPPYFKVKTDAWDHQWDKPKEFLQWLDKCVEQWARILKPNGSLYCFSSPHMAARVEVLISERLNVLNNICWFKAADINNHSATFAHKSKKTDLRSFFPETERIIFAEHYGADNIAKGESGYQSECGKLRGFVFEPLRAYLDSERDLARFTVRGVAEAFQKKTGSRTVTGMAGHWFSSVQWVLPTKENYLWLRALFNGEYLRKEYEELRKEYEELRKEYEELRRPFSVTKDVPYTDVWTFEPVMAYRGKHPCEKPNAMLEHIINASTRQGATVLDCFIGSGSTFLACENLRRRFIGIEQDEHYCEIAANRIRKATQQLDLFEDTAMEVAP